MQRLHMKDSANQVPIGAGEQVGPRSLPLADCQREVNSNSLEGQHSSPEVRQHQGMTIDALRETMRLWLEQLIEKKTGGNQSEFERLTGIHEEDVSRAINGKKGRYVSLTWLVKISQSEGMPDMPQILGELAEVAAVLNTRTQRERLRERIASGEIQARASSVARGRQPAAQPEPPEPPSEAPSSKKGDEG